MAPTTLADLVRPPVSSFIWYMVYSSLRWEGLNPSISGMAREMMTLQHLGVQPHHPLGIDPFLTLVR